MPTREQKFECPYCEEEISKVNYSCYTSGKEWGKAYITEDGEYFEDHECDDSEQTDSYDYEYTCPECEHTLTEGDVLKIIEERETTNEDGKKIEEPKKPKIEELLSVQPIYQYGIQNDKNCFICEKCNCMNIMEEDEESCECTNCSTFIKKTN